jgi:hypothetical protein
MPWTHVHLITREAAHGQGKGATLTVMSCAVGEQSGDDGRRQRGWVCHRGD